MLYSVEVSSVGVAARGNFSSGRKLKKVERSKRGKCQGMSPSSRRRLVRFLGAYSVVDRDMYGMTLTVPDCADVVLWRERWTRFALECGRNDLPFVWRVELQKRGVPHVHLIFWGSDFAAQFLRSLWFFVWGLENHPAALEYGVDIRRIQDDGWALYLIYHQFKHDKHQVGWQGRHWGIVCKRLFSPIPTIRYDLTIKEYGRFRAIYWWFARRRGRKHLSRWAGFDDLASDSEYLVQKIIEHIRKDGGGKHERG